jgi:peptidoglycan/xylan/chitin deacetylase (PgdA/CDA1 family)
MCILCANPTRRSFLGGAAALPLGVGLPHGGLVEPSLRINAGRFPGQVAVTLDACPGGFDHHIATTLVQYRIPATIFITAVWMEHNLDGLTYFLSHPDIFTLENHGALHLPPVLGHKPVFGLPVAGTFEIIQAEVLEGAAAVQAATGRRPGWYRGAAGLYSPETIPFIQSLGFRIAGYSLNSDDGASLPGPSVARRIAGAQDGDVIEGHINQPDRSSGYGIAAGLPALQSLGFQFVKLDEALG